MDIIVPILYKSYGLYVNKEKMLPQILDGLTPVQRRILLGLHSIAKNKKIKTAALLGEVMKRWHPHEVAFGTSVWAVQNEFAHGHGSWGSREGINKLEAASQRYTEIQALDFIEKLAFEYVNYVPWEAKEIDEEPNFIPTMLPLCLITKYETGGIGFGFKANIPTFHYRDLILRLNSILEQKEFHTVAPRIIGCKILSGKEDLEILLRTGKGKIEVQGTYKIDEINKCIYITGWSPQITFNKLWNKIDRYEKLGLCTNKDISYTDCSAKKDVMIQIEVNKQKNVDAIFEKMVKAVTHALKATVSYNIYAVDLNDNVRQVSVDEMLLTTYKAYTATYKKYCITEIEACKKRVEQLTIIKKMKPHLHEAMKYEETKEAIKWLAVKTGTDEKNISELISNHSIRKLLTTNTDIDQIKQEIKVIETDLSNFKTIIDAKYDTMLKK